MSACVEIAVQDAAGVRAAIAGGADRVELCQALALGGLTPSAATIERAAEAAGSRDRLAVLVRPRGGGFVYDADEVALVAADIRHARARGAGAVVVGCLTPGRTVDPDALARWTDAADGAEVVFHRAIDAAADPVAAMDVLAGAGVRRVLTSGGASRTRDGLDVLRALVARSAGRVQVMAGGGVRVDDIPVILECGVDAVHLSARAPVGFIAPAGPGGGSDSYETTDAGIVRTVVAAVRGHGGTVS